jgi:FAD/FMN-containing dehydrogenase
MTTMKHDVIDDFKTRLRGELLEPGDAGFDEARKVWNAMIDRKPAMIVRCLGVADVMRSVAFARDHDLALAVRGGGHNIAGSAICNDGLVIDLSRMKSVRIDPDARRAFVEPGVLLGEFDHEAQAFGLVTPLGINSTTGVAGLTLGGGFGWLTRRLGLAVDNLLAADIVTADGKRLHVNEQSHPDVFWAIRGGGGNFGVVTMFEFKLHAVGPEIFGGLIVFPFEQAETVLQRFRDFALTMPDELTVWAVLRKAPPLPFLPADMHGKEIVALAICYSGAVADGKRAIEALYTFGTPCGEHVGPMPYEQWQQTFDPLLTSGSRNYWKSHNFTTLSNEALQTVIDYVWKLPGSQCEIFIGVLGGQANRVPADATAYAHRDAIFVMNVHTRWDDVNEDTPCVAWARDFFDVTTKYATGGVYVNFLTEDESSRTKAAYGVNYDRLVQVKGRYDPRNLFRQNQNIEPPAQGT